jgi:hypothetical protein
MNYHRTVSLLGARLRMIPAALLVIVASGCSDLSQVWELDHARILAVRLSAPGLAAGERAVVDVLVADDAGVPAVLSPSLVTVSATTDPDVAAAVVVTATSIGWTVSATDADALSAARLSAGLAADRPLEVQLEIQLVIDGNQLTALKNVRLGESLSNPASPALQVDGVPATGIIPVERDREIVLALAGVDTNAELSFDWRTSIGALTRTETDSARLTVEADDPASGYVVVLLRTPAGGVAWGIVELAVPGGNRYRGKPVPG